MGEDDFRDLMEEADIDGPLVDYQAKGNKIEYLGHDTVDGDDAYELKITLKNGDIVYYYLDPDTYLEIKKKKQQFIRGSVRETEQNLGSYKLVAGVYFSIEASSKDNPGDHANYVRQDRGKYSARRFVLQDAFREKVMRVDFTYARRGGTTVD
jgi:hypothetical protein